MVPRNRPLPRPLCRLFRRALFHLVPHPPGELRWLLVLILLLLLILIPSISRLTQQASRRIDMQLKEILVLHHGHLDVGYTHSQPVVWELHREYLDLALDLLEQTAGWPESSRPKWTCEVTAPVL